MAWSTSASPIVTTLGACIAMAIFRLVIECWGSQEPAERLETEQQTTGHLVGSQRPDHMLIHRQDVAQAAIERSLLIDCPAACRLVDELHDLHADADDMGVGGGE